MRMSRDYSGVQEAKDYSPAPPGVYALQIEEIEEKDRDGNPMQTKNSDPMVRVQLMIIGETPYYGKTLFTNVVFFPADAKGAGFTKHWLRVIGEPHDGTVDIDTVRWSKRKFIGRLGIESYTDRNRETRKKNILAESWHKDDAHPPLGIPQVTSQPPAASPQAGKKEEDLEPVPF